MAIIDRIKYDGPEDGSSWLIYKFPSEQFVLGSQLIVNSGQEALFFKGGEALDLFGHGTHTLTTGNLPILNKLVNLPFGGKTPFTAEIYFINRTSRLDMYWGTGVPFDMEDPRYKIPIIVMANGQYGVTVPDARLFIVKLIGAVPNGSLTDYSYLGKFFNGHINTKLKSLLHRFMVQKKISILDVTSYLDDLSKDAQDALHGEFDRFGVEIINFYVETVKAQETDHIKKIMAQRTKIAATKMEFDELGRDHYIQRRKMDTMDTMAANPSSGGVANAVGGIAIASGVMGQVGNAFSEVGNTMTPNNGKQTVSCSKCGTENPPENKFCGICANEMNTGVACPHCRKDVPAGNKFCGHCGKPVGNAKCSNCGTDNPPGNKFCGICANEL